MTVTISIVGNIPDLTLHPLKILRNHNAEHRCGCVYILAICEMLEKWRTWEGWNFLWKKKPPDEYFSAYWSPRHPPLPLNPPSPSPVLSPQGGGLYFSSYQTRAISIVVWYVRSEFFSFFFYHVIWSHLILYIFLIACTFQKFIVGLKQLKTWKLLQNRKK